MPLCPDCLIDEKKLRVIPNNMLNSIGSSPGLGGGGGGNVRVRTFLWWEG